MKAAALSRARYNTRLAFKSTNWCLERRVAFSDPSGSQPANQIGCTLQMPISSPGCPVIGAAHHTVYQCLISNAIQNQHLVRRHTVEQRPRKDMQILESSTTGQGINRLFITSNLDQVHWQHIEQAHRSVNKRVETPAGLQWLQTDPKCRA
jgi:hypothetical protein